MRNKLLTKKRIKYFFLTVVFFCFIFLGLFLIFSPWIKEALIKQEMARYSLENFTATEIQSNREKFESGEEEIEFTDTDFATVLRDISKVTRESVVGAIVIKELNVVLPILEGTNVQNLLVGATTMNTGQLMGSGNYVLAGHHMRNNSLLFGPLLSIETGTWIQLTDKESIYTYEVVDVKLVHETDISVLEETEDPIVTLITCDVSGANTDNRFIVIGKLIDSSSVAEDNAYVTQYRNVMSGGEELTIISQYIFFCWIIGIGLLSLLLIRVLMFLRRL